MERVTQWTIWEAGLSSASLRSFVVTLVLTFLRNFVLKGWLIAKEADAGQVDWLRDDESTGIAPLTSDGEMSDISEV